MYLGITNDRKVEIDRKEKGNSLLFFPTDYTIVDLETTGYSPLYDSILEMCALKVRNNEIIDTFSSLVNSGPYVHVDDFIFSLTGITNEMINSAPNIKDVFPGFIDFIGHDIVIGHNINFDINFLYDVSIRLTGNPFINNFIDTMRISRKLHPDCKHHRLVDLAERYSIDTFGTHRSQKDCEITKACYDALKTDILQNFGNIDEFIKNKTVHARGIRAADVSARTQDFGKSHILYGKVCVFTGTLEKMQRKEAMQCVSDLGGINADTVTKKTNYLILGCNDYCTAIKDGKSSKQKRAEKLQIDGYDISIISEDAFYDMLKID